MVILDFRKVIAVFTTFLFIATSINFNSELYAQPVAASLPALDIHKITVNGSAASLEERFQGHEGPNSRTVIAVQDAHGIFDAQENIRVVIQELQDQYGFELVGLEGGVGKSDHTFLRTFPDKEINAEQARKYMKRAELSGGEAAAILNPKPGIFYGIENRDLYFQNRNSFIKALEHKDTNLHALNLAEKNLDKTRSKIFPEKLLAFHKSVQNFRRGRMSLLDFALVLQSESAAAAIPMNAYPNVLRLFEAIAKARKAGNKEAVNKEVEEATSKIEGRVLFEEIDVLTQEVILSFRRRPESRKIEELLTQYNELQIIRNLVSLQLTRKEYLEFLKLSAEGRIRRGGDSDNYKSLHLTPAETFYRDAVKRDHALYDNFIAAMNREKKDRAIIVTGGFHEEGLRDRLRKENISYVFYAPRIQTITPQDDYYRVMEGKVSYNNKNGRTSSIQAILATMGLDPKLEKEFNQAYAVGGLRALAKEVGSAGSLQPYAKIWQDAIIKTVKERGETLRDPSDLIALVKNAVQLASGQEDVGVMLDHLKQSFSETLSGESRDRVNRFIDDLKQNDFNVEKALAVEGRSLGADPQIESLMREVAADPDNASFRRALVLALLRAKRLDESINALRRGGFGIVDVSPNVRNQIENILNQMAGSIREMPRGTEEDRLAVERVLRNYLLLIRDIQQWPPGSRARINGIRAELLAEPGVSSIVAGYRERMRVLARPIFVNKGLNPDAEFDFDEAYYNPQFYTDPNWFAVDPDTLNVSINLSGHRVIQEDFLILSQIPTLVSLDLTAARYNTGELYNFLAAHSNRESLEVNTFTGMPITAASLGVDPELAGKQRLAAVDLLNDQIQTRVYWEELRAGRYQDAFSRIRRFQQMAGSLDDRNLLKTRVYQTAQSLSESVRRGALDIESMFRLLEMLGAFDWNESEMEVIRPLRADILAREGMPERIDRYSANTRRAVYALFDSNYSVISEQYLNQRLSINRETLGVNLDVSNSGLEDVEALSQIPNLEELNLGSNPLKNIRSVGRLTRLRLLSLNWNPLSDIDSLVNLYRLTRLDLNSTGVGDASVSEFFRAPENPRETRIQKILRSLRSLWYRREITPIRNPEWTNLTVISRSGRQIRWQGTPELGSPEVISELPVEEIVEVQGASLGARIRDRILEMAREIAQGFTLMFALSAVAGCGAFPIQPYSKPKYDIPPPSVSGRIIEEKTTAPSQSTPVENRPSVNKISEEIKINILNPILAVRNPAYESLFEYAEKNPEMGREVLKVIKLALVNSEWLVRNAGVDALARLVKLRPTMNKDIFEVVKSMLGDPNKSVIGTSLKVLAEISKANPEFGTETLEIIKIKFSDNDGSIRASGAGGLFYFANRNPAYKKDVLEILKPGVMDEDYVVMSVVFEVLIRFVEKNPELGKEILETVKGRAVQENEAHVRTKIAEVLIRLVKINPALKKEAEDLLLSLDLSDAPLFFWEEFKYKKEIIEIFRKKLKSKNEKEKDSARSALLTIVKSIASQEILLEILDMKSEGPDVYRDLLEWTLDTNPDLMMNYLALFNDPKYGSMVRENVAFLSPKAFTEKALRELIDKYLSSPDKSAGDWGFDVLRVFETKNRDAFTPENLNRVWELYLQSNDSEVESNLLGASQKFKTKDKLTLIEEIEKESVKAITEPDSEESVRILKMKRAQMRIRGQPAITQTNYDAVLPVFQKTKNPKVKREALEIIRMFYSANAEEYWDEAVTKQAIEIMKSEKESADPALLASAINILRTASPLISTDDLETALLLIQRSITNSAISVRQSVIKFVTQIPKRDAGMLNANMLSDLKKPLENPDAKIREDARKAVEIYKRKARRAEVRESARDMLDAAVKAEAEKVAAPSVKAQGASLGRADMLGNFLEFPADVWIGPSLMGEFRKKNGGKDVQVVKISGDPDEIKSQLADQLEGIPDAEYVFTILDFEKPGTKALDHVVVLDTAEKIRKESARLTSFSGIALNMFQYVLVLNVRFAGDEAPPLLSLDAISVAPELQGQKLMAETFLRIVGALENKFSGLPIAALATSRITAKWFNEYFSAKIMWADDLRDYYKYISMNLDAPTLARMRQRIAEKFPEPIRSQETPPDLNWAIENMDVWPHVRLWGTVGLRKPAPALVTAASLGRQEKFQSDELQYLASELGFGVFDEKSADVMASLNAKINADSTDALGEALYQHILAGLPKLFDNQQNAVRLLLQSKRVLNEADARKIAEDLLNQDAFRNLAGKPEVREKLAKVFTGIVRGAGLEVIDAKRKEEALVRDEALAMFNKNFAASESQADIESALFAELAENQERLWIPAFAGMTKQTREKYQIVPHIGSLAQDREGVKLFISNAFAAVPEGSSVQIDVIYPRGSKERVSGLESYLEEVRKSLPEFASRIRMRELDQRDLVSKLSSYEKRAERDPNQYLIMVMPDAEIAAQVRGASVMIVNDSEIPDELEFVKGYVSKAAVGLAKALKLPKDDPRRTKYLGLLAEAGLTAAEDAASGQIIISLNLRQFVQHLVDLQRARAAIAKAA